MPPKAESMTAALAEPDQVRPLRAVEIVCRAGERELGINISLLEPPLVEDLSVEIVERKGLGHPDSVCDALAEKLSLSLCRYYRDRCGLLLHHNVDKVLLCAGEAQPAFGGGEVIKPVDIFLAGRATTAFKGIEIPVEDLAIEGTRAWLAENFHALDVAGQVRVHSLIRPGSQDLVELYLRHHDEGIWLANDTSCGVGFAPLSELETVVYQAERALNAAPLRTAQPEIGEDIKVMGVRHDRTIALTVSCALVGRFVKDMNDYLAKKAAIADRVRGVAEKYTSMAVDVQVNAADDPTAGSIFLTVTGTSGEAGDDGEAGRGNRANGLITPYRPMTMESVAGKNPVTHVGKLYNLTAGLMADAIVQQIAGVGSAYCSLVSQIGQPIDKPQVIDVRVGSVECQPVAEFAAAIREIVQDQLSSISRLSGDLLEGRIGLDRWPLRLS